MEQREIDDLVAKVEAHLSDPKNAEALRKRLKETEKRVARVVRGLRAMRNILPDVLRQRVTI